MRTASRCLDMSDKQLIFAINTVKATLIMVSESGSLPNMKRRTISANTPTRQQPVAAGANR